MRDSGNDVEGGEAQRHKLSNVSLRKASYSTPSSLNVGATANNSVNFAKIPDLASRLSLGDRTLKRNTMQYFRYLDPECG